MRKVQISHWRYHWIVRRYIINTIILNDYLEEQLISKILNSQVNKIIIIGDGVKKEFYNIEETNEGYNLSKREIQILNLISSGLSNKEISEKLKISQSTVKNHIYNIYKKIDANGRIDASAKFNKMFHVEH